MIRREQRPAFLGQEFAIVNPNLVNRVRRQPGKEANRRLGNHAHDVNEHRKRQHPAEQEYLPRGHQRRTDKLAIHLAGQALMFGVFMCQADLIERLVGILRGLQLLPHLGRQVLLLLVVRIGGLQVLERARLGRQPHHKEEQ